MHSRILILALSIVVVMPATGTAQPSNEHQKLERVSVTLLARESPIKGRLLHLASDEVAVMVHGAPMHIPLSSVRRIEAGGDPVGNGALIGALLFGVRCALICGQGLSRGQSVPGTVLKATMAGALIGAGIDAAHSNRRVIYAAPAPAASGAPGWQAVAVLTLRF